MDGDTTTEILRTVTLDVTWTRLETEGYRMRGRSCIPVRRTVCTLRLGSLALGGYEVDEGFPKVKVYIPCGGSTDRRTAATEAEARALLESFAPA
jgi:hypothetical protein